MSIEDTLKKKLIERGMSGKHAQIVINRLKADDDGMNWSKSYPQPVINVLWISIKHIALDYIKEECPTAWFRPLFED